jgi:hypothetical protein
MHGVDFFPFYRFRQFFLVGRQGGFGATFLLLPF